MIIITNIAHSLFLGVLQGTHLIKIFTATEPCQILVPASFCYALRMPAVMCFDAHMTIHLSIVIERGIALRHLSTYESSTVVTGFALATFSFISALGIAVYTMRKYDFDARTFYCSGATKDTMFEVSITSYSIVAFEAIIIVMFGCIYHLNVRRSNVYDVRAKYQAKENLVVLRLLIPVVFFHFLVFFFFMAASAIASSIRNIFPTPTAFRVYLAAVYLVPVYTLGSPLIMWWILRRHRLSRSQHLLRISAKIKDENDIYFSNYAWNTR
ncbi:hypothetical protein ANCCAN_13167 [Ancylostoma caninum]|uniref:G protein-coupled receptor n=1 Tax=Ancylostoma caninum TaxID=29170 RepID=A0A368G936_ANCCA|nr:hypothetical protein ANCCAN_13167 [Ancylostoma caninum]